MFYAAMKLLNFRKHAFNLTAWSRNGCWKGMIILLDPKTFFVIDVVFRHVIQNLFNTSEYLFCLIFSPYPFREIKTIRMFGALFENIWGEIICCFWLYIYSRFWEKDVHFYTCFNVQKFHSKWCYYSNASGKRSTPMFIVIVLSHHSDITIIL